MILNQPVKKPSIRVFTCNGAGLENPPRLDISAVRAGAYAVSVRARHVRINREAVRDYARRIFSAYTVTTQMDGDNHLVLADDPRLTAQYVMALDSINFGSGYFEVARRAGIDFEYAQIARGLKGAVQNGRMAGPEQWIAATADDFHGMLRVPRGKNAELDELMGLFAHHIAETGKKIAADHQGDVMNLLSAAQGSAEKLANIVASWPTFYDTAFYSGVEIPIFKRAQIFAADIFLALKGHPLASFKDMAQLTMFADNMVPHVLHTDGILEYSDTLRRRIAEGEFIEPSSAEEVEMRAVAIHAVELMVQTLLADGHDVTAVNIDHMLWHRGYEPAIYARPSHKTKTVWY
jgi:hypothetical protein